MSILLDNETRAVVQGITGRIGSIQTGWMLEYGTKLVAGVTPGRGGETVQGLSVYDDVYEAVEKHAANATVLFVPAPFLRDAVLEAIDAGIKLIVAIPEHVPLHDVLQMKSAAKNGAWLWTKYSRHYKPGHWKAGNYAGKYVYRRDNWYNLPQRHSFLRNGRAFKRSRAWAEHHGRCGRRSCGRFEDD